MKKLLKALVVLLAIASMAGCSATKTTVANQKEWDEAFALEKYVNAKVTSALLDDEAEMSMKTTYVGKENLIMSMDEIEGDVSYIYFAYEPEAKRYAYYAEAGEGIYSVEYYDIETEKEWNDLVTAILVPVRSEDSFESITYDQQKKCYCYEVTLLNSYPSKIETYIENGVVVKQIEETELFEDFKMVIERTYQVNSKEIAKLPDIKNKVNSEEEWKALFETDKYSNCTATNTYENTEIICQITSEKIQKTVFTDGEVTLNTIVTPVDDTKEHIVQWSDDSQSDKMEYDLEYWGEGASFADNFGMLTYFEDISDYYDEIKEVDDHYEYEYMLEDIKVLFKLYISNGHITKAARHFEYPDGSTFDGEIVIEFFGKTYID